MGLNKGSTIFLQRPQTITRTQSLTHSFTNNQEHSDGITQASNSRTAQSSQSTRRKANTEAIG